MQANGLENYELRFLIQRRWKRKLRIVLEICFWPFPLLSVWLLWQGEDIWDQILWSSAQKTVSDQTTLQLWPKYQIVCFQLFTAFTPISNSAWRGQFVNNLHFHAKNKFNALFILHYDAYAIFVAERAPSENMTNNQYAADVQYIILKMWLCGEAFFQKYSILWPLQILQKLCARTLDFDFEIFCKLVWSSMDYKGLVWQSNWFLLISAISLREQWP